MSDDLDKHHDKLSEMIFDIIKKYQEKHDISCYMSSAIVLCNGDEMQINGSAGGSIKYLHYIEDKKIKKICLDMECEILKAKNDSRMAKLAEKIIEFSESDDCPDFIKDKIKEFKNTTKH